MVRLLWLLRMLSGQVQLAHMTAAAEAELVIVDAASVVIQPLAVRAGHAAVHRAAGRGRRRGEVCRGADRRAGGGTPSSEEEEAAAAAAALVLGPLPNPLPVAMAATVDNAHLVALSMEEAVCE